MKQQKLFFIIPLLAVFLLTGAGCSKGPSKEELEAVKPVTLEYWSVVHDSGSMQNLISQYSAARPYISVHFRRLRLEEFEQELLEALAEDRGPDIISLHSSWMGKYKSKLLPAPSSVKAARVFYTGGQWSRKRQIKLETIPTATIQQVDRLYLPTVKNDVIMLDETGKEKIWGLPMSMDTLVLYYNQTLLDQAGIPQAPSTWGEFQEAVMATTRYSEDGTIAQAGAAIGTGENVDRAGDIITALMMQNGAEMTDGANRPVFHLIPPGGSPELLPSREALQFYTDFANPTKQVYTWNNDMEQALDAFTRGKTAFFFGYAYHIPLIKARAPKLNYRILQLPQLNPNSPKNVANYWVEAVSKKTENPNLAWDFITFLTNPTITDIYTQRNMKPTALRPMINKQLEDPDLAPFAAQLLTARTWYRGSNPGIANQSLINMIDYVHENRARELESDIYLEAIENAASKINQSL